MKHTSFRKCKKKKKNFRFQTVVSPLKWYDIGNSPLISKPSQVSHAIHLIPSKSALLQKNITKHYLCSSGDHVSTESRDFSRYHLPKAAPSLRESAPQRDRRSRGNPCAESDLAKIFGINIFRCLNYSSRSG